MKIVQINATCGAGSTGKICSAVAALLDQNNVENYIFYSSGTSLDPHGKKFLSQRAVKWQALRSRVFGNYGFNTRCVTRKLLRALDEISPEIVHLHNLHGHNVNLTLLFRYFKRFFYQFGYKNIRCGYGKSGRNRGGNICKRQIIKASRHFTPWRL